ncbi:PREDICTED: U-box domain-containing protein 52-like isoform X1 [Fragaria vesca subsp. vesca]|uniref:U-box domain-containing protein 52-like isoform X1 n=1 Tax=Fragaria vesca subsp. vesca TaxID=101020 RepID=UPI0002C31FF5|nr:PREDICTED: U-box domain-containing protein 52-like isoform X1 [Fragaria vesca subsp. vesca]
MEGDDSYVPVEAKDFYKDYSPKRTFSPEIVELGGEITSTSAITAGSSSRDIAGVNDVYVAVGKDDTDVLKWVLDNAVSPGSRVFLVHVFPPITHIPTPVGRLSTSHLSQDQVRFYINEENNKRRNLLQKYVYLCNNAKVTVDTMLLESSDRAKAIADLIPVLMISHLVIGTKRPPHSRFNYVVHAIRKKKKLSLGEFVRKNAPEYCEVSIVHQGNKVMVDEQIATSQRRPQCERSIYEWACFPVRGKNPRMS